MRYLHRAWIRAAEDAKQLQRGDFDRVLAGIGGDADRGGLAAHGVQPVGVDVLEPCLDDQRALARGRRRGDRIEPASMTSFF